MLRVIPFPALAAAPDTCSVLSSPVLLHDAVAASRRRHRRLIVAAGKWALARGVSLPADHVALWAATAGACRTAAPAASPALGEGAPRPRPRASPRPRPRPGAASAPGPRARAALARLNLPPERKGKKGG